MSATATPAFSANEALRMSEQSETGAFALHMAILYARIQQAAKEGKTQIVLCSNEGLDLDHDQRRKVRDLLHEQGYEVIEHSYPHPLHPFGGSHSTVSWLRAR